MYKSPKIRLESRVAATLPFIAERHHLLAITNLGDLAVTATLSFPETKSESANNVFKKLKYVIFGLPIDVSNDVSSDEIVQFWGCMEVGLTTNNTSHRRPFIRHGNMDTRLQQGDRIVSYNKNQFLNF